MTNDIWSMLSKKKVNTLSIPVKPTQTVEPTNTAPTATPHAKPVKPIKMKAKPHKVKKVQVEQQAQANVQVQQQPQQAPLYQNSDFKFATTIDQTGVQIYTNYLGNLIHKFTLPITDYQIWQAISPQQKFDYVRVRVNTNSFRNDMQLVNAVILTICNILNTIFAEAQRIQAQRQQQAQWHRD
jgi:hypothetical protein